MTRLRTMFIQPFIKPGLAILLLMASLCCNAGSLFSVSSNGATLTIATTVPNHTYPTAGIKITSAGYSLTNPGGDCSPAANGYCLFSVSSTSPHTIAISGVSGTVSYTLCLNGTAALSCQNFRTAITSGPSVAYIVNSTGIDPVYQCPMDDDGMLASCSITGNGFNGAYGIALNKAGTNAYITNAYGGTVSRCPIKDDNSFDTCTTTASGFSYPQGITLNTANTKVYVTNNSAGTISTCPINAQTGDLAACVPSNTQFISPVGIALNATDTKAYVVDYNSNVVSVCTVVPADGTLLDCQNAYTAGAAFLGPKFIALNASSTQAYITNFANGTVSICPIQSNGFFGACVTAANTGSNLGSPAGIALNSANTSAYITDYSDNYVNRCPISGTSLACTDASSSGSLNLSAPTGIALK